MQLKDKLLKFNQWLIVALMFTPLLVSSEFIFPFVHLKNIFFRTLVLILLVSTVWYILERGYIYLKKNWLIWAFGVFFLVQTLASLFGVNLYISVFGSWERMDGLLNLFLIGIFLWVLSVNFQQKKDWIKLLRSVLVSAVVLVLLSLLKNGLNVANNNWSMIGNSAFLGYYLLLNLGLSALLFLVDKSEKWRAFRYVSFLIIFVFLLAASSRAPILGLLGGLLVFGIFYFNYSSKRFKQIFVAGIVFVILFFGLAFWQKDSIFVSKIHFLDRIVHISSEDSSTANRLLVWKSAASSFADRPILGYGPENVQVGINKNYDPEISEQWFDRAHNFIFDYLNTSGILGLLSYLAVFGVGFFAALSVRKKDHIFGSMSFGLLTANLITLLFVFDTINSWILVVLTLSLIYWIWSKLGDNGVNEVKQCKIKLSWYYPLLGAAVFISVLIMYVAVVKPARANYLTGRAVKYSQVDPSKSLSLYDKALKVKSFGDREIRLQMTRYANQAIQAEGIDSVTLRKLMDRSEEAALEYLEKNPHDIQMRMALAQNYLAYATYNTYYIDETINLLDDNIEDSPGRVEIYFMIAQAYYLKGDLNSAITYLEEALGQDNQVRVSYDNLMSMYAQSGDADNLKRVIAMFEDNIDSITAEEYRLIGQYLFQVGLIDDSRDVLLNKAIPADPYSWRSYISYASTFEAEGKINEAIEYLENLETDDAENQKVYNDYIEHLKSLENN